MVAPVNERKADIRLREGFDTRVVIVGLENLTVIRCAGGPECNCRVWPCGGRGSGPGPSRIFAQGLPWLHRNRFLQREASIVIVEFELVLAMMNSSISAERALEAWEAAAVQRCGSRRGLAQHPLPGSERRRFADLDSWRGRSASPVIRHTLAA